MHLEAAIVFDRHGYVIEHVGSSQYNGVAIASQHPLSGEAFIGSTHVTQEEREGFARLLDAGLVDADAATWGEHERRFTWWNHGMNYSRNLGMRIDVIAVDPLTAATIDTTWIDHVERAERPSDHAALMVDFHLSGPGR